MRTDTTEFRTQSGARSMAWLAGAIGAGAGIAAIAYGRRRRSRWDRVKHRANDLVETAREQAKPWMGIAAGGAAAGAALAVYARNRRQSGWQRVSRRARDVASQVGTQTNQWGSIALSAAIALASAASSRKARRRTIRGIDERTARTINSLTEKGLELVRKVRDVSEETRKLYPKIRRVVA